MMDYGAPIENYIELLRVFTIRGSSYAKHPHKMMRVYISRKSLKHFVESRKYELAKITVMSKFLKVFVLR